MSYEPDHQLNVVFDFDADGYISPDALNVVIDFDDDESGSIVIYANPIGLDAQLFGVTRVATEAWGIRPLGINSIQFGKPSVRNNSQFIGVSGFNAAAYGYGRIFNRDTVLKPSGLNATRFGVTKVVNGTAYIRAGAYDFFAPGKPRISYKEQHVTTKQEKNFSLWGNTLVAYGVRYIEQHSPQSLTRYGNVWLSFSPRYIEPRGIFEQFPSYHRIGGSQTVKMEGFDFLRFGTRIIPESQEIRPVGFGTLFGDLEIRNNLHPIKPKGFLTAAEQIGLRFGHVTAYNATQYLKPYHDDTSRAAGPLFPDLKQHEIANLNRTIKTYGRLNTVFGYADLTNKARVIYPVGLASPLEDEPTKTLVADGIRYIKPGSIEAPRLSTWHNIWLGAQNKRMQGPILSLYGVLHVQNTRRIYRFIGLGEQTLFGKAMISHAVRSIRIQSDHSIAPPMIPMPEVKLGTRYVEPSSIDSVRYGWSHLAEKFTKIVPRWMHVERVGEPIIRNVTPEVKPWQLDGMEFGRAYIGLYTRYIKPDGLNAQNFGRVRISDRKQLVDFLGYGVQAPVIPNMHKVELLGAGQLLPHVIYPQSLTTKNFEDDPKKLHSIRQNVLRPESEAAMTMFGNTRIHANSIRVEPGYWEILMGKPLVEHKNRYITVNSSDCDFFSIGKPRMSPHTIWAVVEAPEQAQNNHDRPALRLHYVDGLDANGNDKYPGIVLGTPRISHKYQRPNVQGYFAFGIGKPTVYNVVSKIEPKGWNSLRLGVLGPIGTQHLSFRPKDPMTQWGQAKLQRIVRHDGKLKPAGLILTEIGKPLVDFYHRTIRPAGINSLAMGSRKSDDKPYMWQGLRAGAHVPFVIGGLDATSFGDTWISYRVREAVVQGDDFAQVGEYEPGKFNLRMTIRNTIQPEYPRTQQVLMKGSILGLFGTPNTKLKIHFIRPYGNSDNFRKGGL